jgi:hypothetical protein
MTTAVVVVARVNIGADKHEKRHMTNTTKDSTFQSGGGKEEEYRESYAVAVEKSLNRIIKNY